VTNSAALTAAGLTPSNLVINTFVKFGLRFDGNKTLYFYVNGVQVAKQEVDTTFDQSSYYVAAFNMKTGAATAVTNYVDFIRAAAQVRS
jgi:hypothetical protein